jgi:hypothetical protein
MGAREITTFVCAVAVFGDVVLATPVLETRTFEAPEATIETDGAEVIDAAFEVLS